MKRILSMFMVVGLSAVMVAGAYAQAGGSQRQGQGQQGQQRQGQGQGQRGGMQQNAEIQKKIVEARKKVMTQMKLTAEQQRRVEAATKKRQDDSTKLMQSLGGQQQRQSNGQQQQRQQLTEAQRTKLQADRKKIDDAYNAEMTRILGKDKAAEYERLLRAEMQKIMQEARAGQGRTGQGGGQQGGARRTGSTGGGF